MLFCALSRILLVQLEKTEKKNIVNGSTMGYMNTGIPCMFVNVCEVIILKKVYHDIFFYSKMWGIYPILSYQKLHRFDKK